MSYLELLDRSNLPKHIGIIMDGNGRWAKNKNKMRSFGHEEGSRRVQDIVKTAYNLEIPVLSLYAFSTENWKRPEQEINNLMKLLSYFMKRNLKTLKDNSIKLNIMGDITAFPQKLQSEIRSALYETRDNDKMILNIGLNYGGQDEIVRAVNLIIDDIHQDKIKEPITKEIFENYLYTQGQPPLDLLIRPSGELRVSNFMLYQLAYSEFWFSDVLWPDFTEEVFYKSLYDYQNRHRRFGGL